MTEFWRMVCIALLATVVIYILRGIISWIKEGR